MQEGRKSSLIFISQEKYAVRTKKSFFPCKLCKFALQSSAKGFYCSIMEHSLFYLSEEASHLHVASTEQQCQSLPLELADTLPS